MESGGGGGVWGGSDVEGYSGYSCLLLRES